jgi:hypothetical protein
MRSRTGSSEPLVNGFMLLRFDLAWNPLFGKSTSIELSPISARNIDDVKDDRILTTVARLREILDVWRR